MTEDRERTLYCIARSSVRSLIADTILVSTLYYQNYNITFKTGKESRMYLRKIVNWRWVYDMRPDLICEYVASIGNMSNRYHIVIDS